MSDRVQEAVQNAILRRIDEELVESTDDVMSSVRVDHHQLSETWNRALAFAVRTTPIQQFGIGFGVGWLSGYLFKKVSRTAAFLVGCSFLALQGAVAAGVINVNWGRLRRAAEQRISSVQRLAGNGSRVNTVAQFTEFIRRHVYISSGFATGAVVSLTF